MLEVSKKSFESDNKSLIDKSNFGNSIKVF